MKKPRHLSPDERAVWERVAGSVRPLGSGKPSVKPPLPARTPDLAAPAPYAPLSSRPPQLQRHKDVRRGKILPERTIDLHDMTQDEALAALQRGLHAARRDGAVQVLVVTGKGSVTHGGVLRKRLPEWLARVDMAPMIASYSPAHIRHGGSGAYYVRLKRVKS